MEPQLFKQFAYKPKEEETSAPLIEELEKPMQPPTSLNTCQRIAYEGILRGESIFLTGPGGTGKSFLINTLYSSIPNTTGKTVALTALTGCASLLLHPKAKTIYSWAGIGLGKDPVACLVAGVKKSRKSRLNWLSTDILVIDEVSMMTPELFEKLDKVARAIRRTDTPFGGLQLVLVGDFFQLPPVTCDGETPFVFESQLWKDMRLKTYELTEYVRQKEEIFRNVLEEARRGELSKASLRVLRKRMNLDYSQEPIQPTMLFTRRAQVDLINTTRLQKLTTDKQTFKATITYHEKALDEPDPLVLKAIEKLDRDSSYAVQLVLAVGAQVMLIKNTDPKKGMMNGSRGVVVGFESGDIKTPIVQFRNGNRYPITHTTWEVPEMPGIMRKQIPLKLAYAITIHKAQGATLDCALIDVGDRTFEVGQAYVALSRVKDLEGLYIHDLDPAAFRASEKVKAFYKAEGFIRESTTPRTDDS